MGQIILLTLVGLGATAFTTAWLYRIDEVITAQGRLVPRRGGVEVKGPISGQLADVVVENGDLVEKGDLLLRYDVLAAKDQEVTLTRQLKLEEKRLEDQLRSNSQRQETLKRNIGLREKSLNASSHLKRLGRLARCKSFKKPIGLKA